MQMPKLLPKRIKTKGEDIHIRIWRWMTVIRKWEVGEDWEFDLPDGQRIVIPKGFIFDGASIPRLFWGILSPTGLLLIPGLIHDFGYRYDYIWALDETDVAYRYQTQAGKTYWDTVFSEVGLQVNGMPIFNWMAWITLVTMGRWAWESNRKRNEPEVYPEKFIPIAQKAVRANEPIDSTQ